MNNNTEDFIESKIESIIKENNIYHIGKVTRINSFIIEATGLEDAFFFEKVYVGDENNIGYVDKIEENKVFIALVKTNGNIKIGDSIKTTGEALEASFSKNAMGMIVDAFGVDRMTGKSFNESKPIPIETPKIPIMERTPVNRPLETGIAGIDLMFPIGRGQRQLIIGDKKTGKTQILLDTIINQRGKNVICIYVSIGKTKKEVKRLYSKLVEKGANAYTQIVAVFNDDTSPLIKLTPYVGLSIAEEYMREGFDVLVCIDDLKKHADSCREIALISEKNTGREAYPSDIFYIHSRLLEKGCQYKNGGSITILPVVETKGGDITDYISTNIISITDGQIVLSEKSFKKGQKPAIDFGLSVSRLGGAVQNEGVKKVGAAVRRELLSYLETADVYQLVKVDAMSKELQAKVFRGKKLLELLNQPKFSPRSEEKLISSFEFILEDGKIVADPNAELLDDEPNDNNNDDNNINNNSQVDEVVTNPEQLNVVDEVQTFVENENVVMPEQVETEVSTIVNTEVPQENSWTPEVVSTDVAPASYQDVQWVSDVAQETVWTPEVVPTESEQVENVVANTQELSLTPEVVSTDVAPVTYQDVQWVSDVAQETAWAPEVVPTESEQVENVVANTQELSLTPEVVSTDVAPVTYQDVQWVSDVAQETAWAPEVVPIEPAQVENAVATTQDIPWTPEVIPTEFVPSQVEPIAPQDVSWTPEVISTEPVKTDVVSQDYQFTPEIVSTELVETDEVQSIPEIVSSETIDVEDISEIQMSDFVPEETVATLVPNEDLNGDSLITSEVSTDNLNQVLNNDVEMLATTEIPVENINNEVVNENIYTTEVPVIESVELYEMEDENSMPVIEQSYTVEIPKLSDNVENNDNVSLNETVPDITNFYPDLNNPNNIDGVN